MTVYIFRMLVQHSHMYVHPDPKILRRGAVRLGNEISLMAIGLGEVCMNVRELITGFFQYEEIHIAYANILRAKLASLNIFGE